MEKQKKNNNILLIVLVILVFGLGGFIVYDKILKDDKSNNNDNYECKDKEDNQNVLETNNSFELFKNNLIKERNEKYDSTNNRYLRNLTILDKNNDTYYFSLSKDGVLELTAYEESKLIKTKTISDKVLLFYITDVANAGFHNVYFIKEDGTVSSWCIDSFVKFDQEKIENNIGNFKNIISIIPGSIEETDTIAPGEAPAFVDINGNIFFPNY